MNIDRVIISTTSDPLYTDGLDFVKQAWRNMGVHVTVIQIGNVFDAQIGNSFSVPSIPGIPDANTAKLMRVLFTKFYPNDWCLISDADMLPMDPAYFIGESKKADLDSILFYTSELTGDDAGKYPACYMLAKGSTFTKYVNPRHKPLDELIHSWDFGYMADPKTLPFSDESVYRELFKHAPKVCLKRYHQTLRLCRSDWPENLTVDEIKSSRYIDCHMPRPASENMDKLKPVLDAIGVKIIKDEI
jgi:hypothetical protein